MAERDASLWENEDIAQEMKKKDPEIKKIRAELRKVQAYTTEYLMKEEEYVREMAKAKEDVESMRKAHGKYTEKVNSLHRQVKHAKKERKEEANIFEQQVHLVGILVVHLPGV